MNKNLLLSVFVALTIFIQGCGESHDTKKIERPEISGVEISTVGGTSLKDSYEVPGTVMAKSVSMIASRVQGTVTSLHVKEGDRVKKGQLLLTLDDRDLKEKVRAAEEGYNEAQKALNSAMEQRDLAQKTWSRFERLHKEKALSLQELDNIGTKKKVAEYEYQRVEAMVNRARAGLDEARVFTGFARIKSPADGVVSQKNINIGSMANPGLPLLVIEDDSAFQIHANLDERMLLVIYTGMGAEVHLPSLKKVINGAVSEVVPTIDPQSRTFTVKLDIEDGSLRSGLYGKVRFTMGRKDALLVPERSVVRKGQLTGVYLVKDDGLVTYRIIKSGRTEAGLVEVLSGLREGDRIITGHIENAIDGGIIIDSGTAGSTAREVN